MRARTLLAAISPCPNDTFCWQPWAEGHIRGSIPLDLAFHDVQRLNVLAMTTAPYDLSKLSTACLPHVQEQYVPLMAGAAFAINSGPSVVACSSFLPDLLCSKRVAIPGKHTSAYAACTLIFGPFAQVVEMPSAQIISSVQAGECDAGVVIHEGRDVALQHGLVEVANVGDQYRARFGAPLPLGVIVARQSLGHEMIQQLNATLRLSIHEARARAVLTPFVCDRAQEHSPDVLWQHIHRYVTPETESMTSEAQEWTKVFLEALRSR